MATTNERVPLFPAFVKHNLKVLLKSESELVVSDYNATLARNAVMLGESEIPIETIDSDRRKKIEELEAELKETGRKLDEKRAMWPELQRRHRVGVRVNIPEDPSSPPASADTDGDESIGGTALKDDLKRWQNGVLAKRAQKNAEQVNRTKAHAARARTAVTMHTNAVARGEKYSDEPTITLDVTPTGTPEARAKEAFAKRGLSLPMMSPNVTPRSRKVRRKLSSNKRLSSLR